MRFLTVLFSLASGYLYTVSTYNGSTCSGTALMASTTVGIINNVSCQAIQLSSMFNNMTNITTNTSIYFQLSCCFGTNLDSLAAYTGCACFGGMQLTNNTTPAGCHYYPSFPGYSFNFVQQGGGQSACAGLIQAEKELAAIFCISGDTALQTPEGSVLAKDLQVGTPILTAQGDYKPVQVFWHRLPEASSCVRVCSKTSRDCAVVSGQHYIRSSRGFETAETLPSDEFSVSEATCDGLVSFHVEGGAFVTQQGGMEISSFSKTWGMSHETLLWLTEWTGVLALPVSDWTVFAETSRCLQKGALACMMGSLAKLF